ncbi:MAG: hypothetical protein U0133_18670 [Gemmatimonadales bacterium]
MTAPLLTPPAVQPYAFPEGEWPGDLAPLQPAARAQADALAVLARFTDLATRVADDPHLTPEGKRARLTEALSADLRTLESQATRVDALAHEVRREVDALVEQQSKPAAGTAERDEEAIGRLPLAERTALLEQAMTGKDARALAAFAHAPHWLTGIREEQRGRAARILREQAEGAVATEARDRLAARARIIGQVRETVAAVRDALESAVDRKALRERGVPLALRRSDMSEAERVAYIGTHGLDAFKALPA